MESATIISILALAVSFLSLGWAIYIGKRDSAKLKTETELHYEDGDSMFIRVRITNAGRRPILLTFLGAYLSDGNEIAQYLDAEPKRLSEHEMIEKDIRPSSIILMDISKDIYPTTLWVEDTLGRKHKIAHSKQCLADLKKEIISNNSRNQIGANNAPPG